MTVAVSLEAHPYVIAIVTGASLEAADRDAIFEILDDNMQQTFGRCVLLDARGVSSLNAIRSLLRNLAFRGFTKIAVIAETMTHDVAKSVAQTSAIDLQLHSSAEFATEWLCNEFGDFA